jgi:hypothetical protein
MTIHYYKTGQKVRVTCQFKVGATLTDPTTVTCKVMDPSKTVTTYVYGTDEELVKSSTGIYYVDITTDESDEWNVRFEGTGTCVAVDELTFGARTAFA